MEDYGNAAEFVTARISRRRVLQGIGLAGALAGISPILAACGSGGAAENISSDELKVAIGGQPNSLDPHKYSVGADNYFILNVFEMLLDYGPDGKQRTAVAAETPTVSADGLVYTVKLNTAAKFHDGSPVTAEDVKFSYERAVDPKTANPYAFLLKRFDHVAIVDPATIEIHMSAPDAGFMAYGGYVYVVPKAYVEKVGDEEFGKAPIGTGPYKFVSRALNKNFILEKFDDYWGEKGTFKKAVFNIIPENTARVTALNSGQAHVISAIPPQKLKSLKSDSDVVVKNELDGDAIDIKFNCLPDQQGKPWMNVKVREALDYAINRDELLEKVMLGEGQAVSYFQATNATFDAGLKAGIKPREYDPDKAKKLLKEAGYAKGFELSFSGLVNGRIPNSAEISQAIAGYWGDVGVDVKLSMLDYSTWISSIKPGTTYGAVFNIYGDRMNGPTSRLSGMYRSDGTYALINDPELDELVDQSAVSIGDEQIDANYIKVAEYLMKTTYVLPLYSLKGSYGMAKGIAWTPWRGQPVVRAVNAKPA